MTLPNLWEDLMRIGPKWNGTAWMALAIAALAGCESEPLPGEREQAINGTAIFTDTWDPAQMDRIRAALVVARDRMASPAMLNCLKESQMAGPNTAPSQPLGTAYPEWIQARMLEDLPTEFAAPDFWLSAEVGVPYERVLGLAATNPETLAAKILHEVGHNKGWTHVLTDELGLAVPDQLEACSRDIGEGVVGSVGHGYTPRSAIKQETTLAPVGLPKGEGVDTACPGTQVAVGIMGFTKRGFRVGLSCRERGGSTLTDTDVLGGEQDVIFFRRTCPVGSVMVGAWGTAREYVSAIGPLCASEGQVIAGSLTSQRISSAGTLHGLDWERRCPAGMAVKELRGRTVSAGGSLQAIELTCQLLSNLQPILKTRFPEVGIRGNVTTVARESCIGRAAVGSLLVSRSSAVARVSGFCFPVSTSPAGVDFVNALPTWLPGVGAHGGDGLVAAAGHCPDFQMLVGVRIGAGSPVSAVQGVCAPVSDWDTPGTLVFFTLTSWLGGTPALPLTDQVCPRGQFVTGLSIAANDFVQAIGITCRDFQGVSQ